MVDLMAGIAVVGETEAWWEVTEHGAVFIEPRPERATGHAMHPAGNEIGIGGLPA